jgi:hypothetical protein
LRYRLRDVPYEDRNVLTHSHGISSLLYGTTYPDPDEPPILIRNALCICPPPREEFLTMAMTAMRFGMIASLRVVYADGWDLWARLGQIGDGHWGWRRSWDIEHPRFVQHGIKGIGHSGVFEHGARRDRRRPGRSESRANADGRRVLSTCRDSIHAGKSAPESVTGSFPSTA